MSFKTKNIELHAWNFSGLDQDFQPFSLEVSLPIDTASRLYEGGLLPNPYYGQNEFDCRWIGEREWDLETHFLIEETDLSHFKVLLLDISWVDTYATLYINKQKIQTVTNTFDRSVINIYPWINAGKNDFRIVFHRTDLLALKRSKTLPFPIPSSMGNNNKIPHMNLVRKVQCHSGWDWGICLPVSGLYHKPEIRFEPGATLLYITHELIFPAEGYEWVEVVIEAHTEVFIEGLYSFSFSLHDQETQQIKKLLSIGEQVVQQRFKILNPKLWWPAGYGASPLYAVRVDLSNRYLERNIGIRKIHWNTQKDEIGIPMTLEVNDKAIFCKGANWIPNDAMPERQFEKYEYLLQSAVEANMNMIRVWGGGQYEHDEFYDACDKMGLLVWQDMMFSCSLFPSQPWFLEEVRSELKHQLRRLNTHPSIVLYCGDNEVIGALNWYEESRNEKQRYTVNYDRLNQVIAQSVQIWDKTKQFWPSSPCNGEIDFGDGWHDDTQGDMHFWDVWHSGASFEAYYKIQPRFCSEFGFQSFSSLATLETYTNTSQYNISAPDFEHHQKNERGNSIILEMFSRYFRVPHSFEQQIYLSQLQQALAISLGVEYWRTSVPICMGTLYWQLNDNWPVHSWSSIEYTGRWKLLQYAMQRVYHPLLVSAVFKDHSLSLWGVNEAVPRKVQITGGLFNLEGKLVQDISMECELQPNQPKLLLELSEASLEVSLGSKNFHSLHFLHYHYTSVSTNNSQLISSEEKTLFLCEPKKYQLPYAKITYNLHNFTDNTVELTLESSTPCFFLFLECSDAKGRFSENGFTLDGTEKKTLVFTKSTAYYWEDFNTSLRITQLAEKAIITP